MPSDAPSSGYSRAFEAFVQGDDDLLGLLAYALYKKGIQQARADGRPVPNGVMRHPSSTEVQAYRSSAKDMLAVFGESAQNSARESILDGGLRPDLDKLRTDLQTHIDRRTSTWSAFLVNLAAWVASIGLTVLFFLGLSAPSWAPKVKAALGLE